MPTVQEGFDEHKRNVFATGGAVCYTLGKYGGKITL